MSSVSSLLEYTAMARKRRFLPTFSLSQMSRAKHCLSYAMARKRRYLYQHYSEALAYLRDYCLRHGRLMHFSHGDIFEAEGTVARLLGYIGSGSFHYLVRNYEGVRVLSRPSLRATLWTTFPTVSMAMPLPSPSVPTSPAPSMSSMVQTLMSTTARVRRRSEWAATIWLTA